MPKKKRQRLPKPLTTKLHELAGIDYEQTGTKQTGTKKRRRRRRRKKADKESTKT